MTMILLWGAGSKVQDRRSPVQANNMKSSASNDPAQKLRLVMKVLRLGISRMNVCVNIRIKEVGVTEVPQVGEVHAIDGRFAVYANHA